jgi:hypothetical protein
MHGFAGDEMSCIGALDGCTDRRSLLVGGGEIGFDGLLHHITERPIGALRFSLQALFELGRETSSSRTGCLGESFVRRNIP